MGFSCDSLEPANLVALPIQVFNSIQKSLAIAFLKAQIRSFQRVRIQVFLIQRGIQIAFHLEVCFSQILILLLVRAQLGAIVGFVGVVEQAIRPIQFFYLINNHMDRKIKLMNIM